MDYVFGVIVSGDDKVICGIWPELRYLHGAAASIMTQCAEMAMNNGEIIEAMKITGMAMDIPKDITEEVYKRLEDKSNVMTWQTDHFLFNFLAMPALKFAMESDSEVPVIVGAGGDHRKCPYQDECTHSPTQEQIDNGWVPWETEEIKS